MSEEVDGSKKWEAKQITIGAGSAVALIMFLQSQGLSLIDKSQKANNSVIIEKTIANAARISKLESSDAQLNSKIDTGFDSLRTQLREETARISEIFRQGTQDKFTKTDHLVYRQEVQQRIERLEDTVSDLGKEAKK